MAITRLQELKRDVENVIAFINAMPDLQDHEWIHLFKLNFDNHNEDLERTRVVREFFQTLEDFNRKLDRSFSKAIPFENLEYGYYLNDFLFQILPNNLSYHVSQRLEQFALLALEVGMERKEGSFELVVNRSAPKAKLVTDISAVFKAKVQNPNPARDLFYEAQSANEQVQLALLSLDIPEEKEELFTQSIDKIKHQYLNNLNEFIEQLLSKKIDRVKAKEIAIIFEKKLDLQLRKLCSDEFKDLDMLNERCRYILSLQGIEDITQLYKQFYLKPKLEKQARLHNKNFEHIAAELEKKDVSPLETPLRSDAAFQELFSKYQKTDELQNQVIRLKEDSLSQKPLESIKKAVEQTFNNYSSICKPTLTHSRDKLFSKAIKTFFGIIFTGVIFYPLLHNKIWGARSEVVTAQTSQKFFKLVPPKTKPIHIPIQNCHPRF